MFSNFLSFDHSCITGVLHGGSTWWFAKDLTHSRSVLQESFWRCSSILHLAFQSAIPSTLSFEMVLCHSWQFPSCFMIHMLSRMRYFKSINLLVGVILGYISPKAFHWECCYLWCVSMIQIISLSSWWKKFFISLVLSIILLVSIVAGIRLSFEKFSISPLQVYSFRCWFSKNSVITFL